MSNYLIKIAKNIKKLTKPARPAKHVQQATTRNINLPANDLQGYFDGVLPTGELYGWAYNESEPLQRSAIYFAFNNTVFGTTTAKLERYDLIELGKSDGCCAFVFAQIPIAMLQELKPQSQIHAFFDSALQTELLNSPLTLTESMVQQLYHCALNPLREDLSLNEQKTALMELLNTVKTLDNTEIYPKILVFCCILLQAGQSFWLQQQLTFNLFQTRHTEGLAVFELVLLKAIASHANNSLSSDDLQWLETELYAQLHCEHTAQEQARSLYHSYLYPVITHSYRYSHLLLNNRNLAGELSARFLYLLGIILLNLYRDYSLAANIFDFVRCNTDFSEQTLLLEYCGKTNRLLERNFEAMQDFSAAIRANSQSAVVYQETAALTQILCEGNIQLLRQSLPRVLELLLKSFQLNSQKSGKLQQLADSFLRQFFQSSIAHTESLAKKGEMATALLERRKDLATLISAEDSLHVLTGQGCYQGAKTNQQIKRGFRHIQFVGSKELWQCYQYRVVQKMEQAQTLGYKTTYIDTDTLDNESWKRDLAFTDVLYICRVPAVFTIIKLISYAHQLQIPVIYDIDDYLFDERYFPAPLESYAGTIDQNLHIHLTMDNPFFEYALQLADFITCSTPPLAERISEVVSADKTVVVHPNLLSPTLYQVARHAKKIKQNSKNLQIFYGSATKAHKQVIYEVFGPALLTILQRYPQVSFMAFGYFQLPDELEPYADRIEFRAPTDRDYYLQQLSSADINIAALEQDPFTDCKSEIKWLEAAVFGIPSIVTPTATYKAVVEAEKHILFASNAGEWTAQLIRLIESAPLRYSLGENARKLALESYDPAVGAKILETNLTQTLGLTATAVAIVKPRLLYVNVWFAPQAVGGATRVFESHLQYLLNHYAEDYELYVLTSQINPESDVPYSVEQFLYGSVLVTRLNVPLRDWSETYDEMVERFCEEFYRNYGFDLIHFHALPIMTASVVDAARKLNIPYLITLHDGWWLSTYMFLVTETHELVDTTQAFATRDSNARQQQLYQCLQNANAVLAVSKQFRDIYQRAGITKTITNENGVELFTVLPRTKITSSRAEKVRVAHIGGMSYHKGYDLFKEAVSQGNFQHLEVHIIDHSLESGEIYQAQWGSTQVIFHPKFKQSEVNVLYASIDVLVAPSIWPESFGLVTREAAYAGVWVIASDRGAVGECVEDGVNGWVVSVDNCVALQQALGEVDADPLRFLQPCPQKTSRSVADQVKECVQLYQTILAT